jgi:uncharacterized protein (DUF1501 family)
MSTRSISTAAPSRLARVAESGCADQRMLMNRRSMLGMSAGLFSSAFMPKWAEAATSSDPRLLVVVLRGGMDGLAVVSPFGDGQDFSGARRTIYVEDTLKLNDPVLPRHFGLHPELSTLHKWYGQGDAAIVHACAPPLRIRSHFECQDSLESGQSIQERSEDGWLNRLLGYFKQGEPLAPRQAIQIGQAPLILRGSQDVLGWTATTINHVTDPTLYMINQIYKSSDRELYDNLVNGLEGRRMAEGGGAFGTYDDDAILGFAGAGRLLNAARGPRIAVLSIDGWDTHSSQGDEESGNLKDQLWLLNQCLGEFRKNMSKGVWRQTVMMIVTEFGRTVRQNGTGGTDHGVGTVAFLAGGAVRGGRVVNANRWPGLSLSALQDGRDLRAVTDIRSVFKGVLLEHFGVPDNVLNTLIFPGSADPIYGAPALTGLIKT